MSGIPVGTTVSLTWKADGVAVTITPTVGSAITFSCQEDRIHRVIEAMMADAQRGASVVGSVNILINASSQKRSSGTHIGA